MFLIKYYHTIGLNKEYANPWIRKGNKIIKLLEFSGNIKIINKAIWNKPKDKHINYNLYPYLEMK